MPRNAEVIRQWSILRELANRRSGCTIKELSIECDVSTRTIRRDLEALQYAGFPLTEHEADSTGAKRWGLLAEPFRKLSQTGFTLTELSALYFSRSLVECLAGTPFQDDLRSAFDKLVEAIGPQTRRYLDQLPSVLATKPEPQKKRDSPQHRTTVARLVEATLFHRKAAITYHSFSSRRVKDYQVEPYRLAYGQGGLYLFAYVPEYGQMRTFAVERIKRLSLLEEHFSPVRETVDAPFAGSLGINSSGKTERVEIEFSPRVAPYIQERTWHQSQKISVEADGAIVLAMTVCIDWALTSWILSFGPFARVVTPSVLAEQILAEIEDARDQYAPRMPFALAPGLYDADRQRLLPLEGSR
jgi:predicted DNA-binding transcriptional regulator YafY